MPVIGFLHAASAKADQYLVVAFTKGLSQTGYIEGQNVAIDYRWAEGQYDRLPALAADLVRRPVAVLATGAPVAALAAKQATTSIPIVFLAAIRLKTDLSRASTGPEATSQVQRSSLICSMPSGLICCANWFPTPKSLLC
jgi:putative ABC transport system substrate-binding protein